MTEDEHEIKLAKETCMCGDPIEGHASAYLCGHTPVSMWDHHLWERSFDE